MDKRIPVYTVTIDKSDELGVEYISLVDEPAIMIDFVAMSKEEETMVFTALADQQKLAGAFLVPDQKIYRNDNGEEYYITFTAETIAKVAERFNENLSAQNVNLMHQKNSKVEGAFILENWIIEDSESDKSNRYGFTLPAGTWFGLVKVNNADFWANEVKTGKVRGFSIEGVLGMVKINNSKQIKMNYKFKNIGMIAATNGEAEGQTVAVVAEAFEVGESIVVIGSDLAPVSDFTGEVMVDGVAVTVSAGVITAVGSAEAPAEPVAPEAPAEAAAEPTTSPMNQEQMAAMIEPMLQVERERISALEERLGAMESALNEAKSQAEQMSAQVAMNMNIEKVVDEPVKADSIAERVLAFRNKATELKTK